MATVMQFLSLMENTQYFQIELFVLLGSLLLSLLLNSSWPYFLVSSLCFFIADSILIFELLENLVAGNMGPTSAVIEVLMTTTLLATLIYALAKRMEPQSVKLHAAITLTFSMYLALEGSHLWKDKARSAMIGLDRYEVQASGFAAMHLFSALLMLYDSSQASPRIECEHDEKTSSIV